MDCSIAPETSTSNRCCIDGMFRNNSCGTHSLVYCNTCHHVIACKGVLSDGSVFDTEHFEMLDKILTQLETWAADGKICRLIEENHPDKCLQRRSCGYAINEVIGFTNKDKGLALCKLLAGSEGTLAFITEIKVSLDVLPPKEITTKALDTLLIGAKVNVIPSGCCGMAGSFGYEKTI